MVNPGLVLSLAGTNIKSAYGAGTDSSAKPLNVGRAGRLRFTVVYHKGAGSVTSVTLKLKQRYNDYATTSPVVTAWTDLPSHLDDVQGAAQPKGSTFEIEHTFTISNSGAGVLGDNTFTFYLDKPQATLDLAVDTHASAAGDASDTLNIYAQAA